MKLLFFVFILNTNLFLVNVCSQDLNSDFNGDYPIDTSDQKHLNSTSHFRNDPTSNSIGINTNFYNSLTSIFAVSSNDEFFIFNCFFL